MSEKRFRSMEEVDEYLEKQLQLDEEKCCVIDVIQAEQQELLNLFNSLVDENEQLRLELETHKHPLWSTREAERKLSEAINNLANEIKKNGLLNEEINQLRIENMRLKKKGGDGV